MVASAMEFYVYEDELWCRTNDGRNFRVEEDNTEIVSYILNNVRAQYPEAYDDLEKCYQKSAANPRYYHFLMARRFCKCNFGNLDPTEKDVRNMDDGIRFRFERVACPLRGECPYEGRICMPKFNSNLSKSEYRVMRLLYEGLSKDEISIKLFVSPWTVNSQIRTAYLKLGVHSEAEFVKYATDHNLFKEPIKE